MKNRYILRYKGSASDPAHEVTELQAAGDLKIVDRSTNRSILVEVSTKVIETVKRVLSDWYVIPETHYEVPNTRVRLGKRNER